jgi:hypothetical protein
MICDKYSPKLTIPAFLILRGLNAYIITFISNPVSNKWLTILILSIYHAAGSACTVSTSSYL